MWFLPSRGRPHNLKRFIQAYKDTRATTPVYLWFDIDDPKLPEYQDLDVPNNWCVHVNGSRNLAEMMNRFVKTFPDAKYYGFLADDCVPRTAEWDRLLINAAGDWGISYPNDLFQGDKLSTFPCCGGKLIRALGWWGLPGLDRLYIDDALMAVGLAVGKLVYLENVVLEHMHFGNRKAPMDATYRKTSHAEDEAVFRAWDVGRDLPRIRAAMKLAAAGKPQRKRAGRKAKGVKA
uniref:Putative glycosyltransferase n=1 Tax=viral metagenome TaxID=1070528 RepID=A0A6M3XJU4_9ZZZZ